MIDLYSQTQMQPSLIAGNEPYPLDLSIVLPIYNERETIRPLYERLCAVVDGQGWNAEFIFVDDGSTDDTLKVLLELHERDPRVIVVAQRRNFGVGQALNVGLHLARGAMIVTMDTDLQVVPEDITLLLDKLNKGYDLVCSWKRDRRDPLVKRLQSRLGNLYVGMLTGVKLHDINSLFKAFRPETIEHFYFHGEMYRYMALMAHFAGFRVDEVPVVHHPRQHGRSRFGAGRIVRGFIDALTIVFIYRYGRRPMHVFGVTGLMMLAIGFLINLTLSLEWLAGVRPIGDRPALILGVLLMLMGGQFFTLGLLAEMIISLVQRGDIAVKNIYRNTARIYRRAPLSDKA